MSSMLRVPHLMLSISLAALAVPALAQTAYPQSPYPSQPPVARTLDGREWDAARAQSLQSHDMAVHQSIDRWKVLSANDRMGFSAYTSFLLTYPGYPQQDKIRGYAEKALLTEAPSPQAVVAYFDRFEPLTSRAAGRYAVALATMRRAEAGANAVAAWRKGALLDADEAMIRSQYGSQLTAADHDIRMDALLWQGERTQAERQISFVSAARRAEFMERLTLLQGSAPGTLGISLPPSVASDPG